MYAAHSKPDADVNMIEDTVEGYKVRRKSKGRQIRQIQGPWSCVRILNTFTETIRSRNNCFVLFFF